THVPEPIHPDTERAAGTEFGGTIAHGFLTLSFLSSFAYALVPMPDDMDHPVNYGFDKVRFTGPVPSGGRIRGSMVLSALEPGPVTKLHLKVSVEVENQPRPALVADWIIGAIRH
ncbi:MAG: MaoC/PaaZ C-terminal domain-containing protein, partial [Pseudomonadota bacterium]